MFSITFWNKNYNDLDDEQLLQNTKQGKKAAFEVLYDRWNKKIYNYLLTIVNYNREDASNLLSEVFIKIYEYNKNKTIKTFKSFVYRTAKNQAIDRIKTKKSEQQSQFDEDFINNIQDQNNIKQKEDLSLEFKQNILQKFINQLDHSQKEVLHLYFFEERSYDEIANILWSNKNSIWTLIFKAKKNLKSIVERAWFANILLTEN